jgi:pimeloyl-ACP methyl ester carboxylesterase
VPEVWSSETDVCLERPNFGRSGHGRRDLLLSLGMELTNGSTRLHVAEDGPADAPPIVLLHGITSSVLTWDWIVPELASRFHVLRLDFRGHGRSDRTPDHYGPVGYVGDAVALLEKVGRPCVVMGHSLGGVTAAALTQQRPDLVSAAIMEDPPLGPVTPRESTALEGNSLLVGFRLMRDAIPRLQASGISADSLATRLADAPHTTGAGTFGEMLYADALQSMAASMLAVDATVLDPVLNGSTPAFLDPDRGFGVPSLILAADPAKPDAVADPDAAQRYVDGSPDVEFAVIAGAGHLIHDEKASREAFRSRVMAYLDRRASP